MGADVVTAATSHNGDKRTTGADAVALRRRGGAAAGTPLTPRERASATDRPRGAARAPGVLAGAAGGFLLAPLAALAAAVAGAVRRPSVLVAIMLLLICVPVQADIGGSAIGLGDVASVALVLAAGAAAVRDRVPVSGFTAGLFGALVLGASAATLTAADPAGSLVGWIRYVQLFVLVPLAVVVAARSRRDALLIARAAIAVALLQGVVGVWQYVTGTGASYAGEPVRAVGTFGADDVIAMSTVVGLGLVLSLGLALGTEGRRRLGYLAVTVVLVIPLGLSLSRGGWIATGVAVLVVLLCASVRTFLLAMVAAAALTTVVVGGFGVGSEQLADRLGSITSSVGSPDSSVSDRYYLWQTAVDIWSEHPLTGVGIKAFPEFRDTYAPLGLNSGSDVQQAGQGFHREALLSPHNQYLLVLSEQGLVGGAAFAVVVLVLAVMACASTRRAGPPSGRGIRLGVAGLATWQLVQFLYGDLGGPASLTVSMIFGLAAAGLAPRGVPRGGQAAAAPGPVPAAGVRAPRAATVPPSRVLEPAAALLTVRPPVPSTAAAPDDEAAPVRTGPPAPPTAPPAPAPPGRSLVARAAMVSAVLAGIGAGFGLVRDLLVAALFGASAETDAFVVAWTIPETIAPLLIEGTMALVMVPAFGRAIAAAEERQQGLLPGVRTDPVRELIEGTLPRMLLVLAGVAAFTAAGAPWLVEVLAPGLADPELATRCMRAVAVTVPLMGVAGYLAAALRTYQRFAAPAAIYLAYNIGIIVTMLLTYRALGVLGAAVGIAVGAALMVLVQLPAAVARVPLPRTLSLRRSTTLLTLAAVLPVAGYSLARQAQTFVERFAASPLAQGSISHLNYAQKVAQIPITLSFMAAAVTFPMFAKSVAAGRHHEARRRMEIDTLVVGAVALMATAYLWVFAPAVVATLFERGAFTAEDTASTAAIMRAYVLGLTGQALVGVLVRPYFTHPGAIRWPAMAMLVGLGATVAATLLLVGPYGAVGIALANALGISVTALILAVGSRRALPMAAGRGAYGLLGLVLVPAAGLLWLGTWWRGLFEGSAAPFVAVSGGLLMVITVCGFLALVHLLPFSVMSRSADDEEHVPR